MGYCGLRGEHVEANYFVTAVRNFIYSAHANMFVQSNYS